MKQLDAKDLPVENLSECGLDTYSMATELKQYNVSGTPSAAKRLTGVQQQKMAQVYES